MKIESSAIAMTSSRTYHAEGETARLTILRPLNDEPQKNTVDFGKARWADNTLARYSSTTARFSVSERERGAAVFTGGSVSGLPVSGRSGSIQEKQDPQVNARQSGAAQTKANAAQDQAGAMEAIAEMAKKKDWLSEISEEINNDPKIQILRKALEILKKMNGDESSPLGRLEFPESKDKSAPAAGAFQLSASAVSLRYQKAMSLFGGEAPAARENSGSNTNGLWTRQVIQSGFVKGEEHTAFCSTGTVVTGDGRTIDFGVTLEMSRSFASAYETIGKEEVYTDPLVINLDTDTAALSDVTFYFDLNCDGRSEEISALDSSSGFLALDRNGDGKINDGSELFGARSGDGFGELARYDQDGNGWIDEGDDIFSQLSVWVRCGDGGGKLLSLSEANVGAIFLGSQSTQHTLTNSDGESGAMLRRTGIYLKESGEAGTVQHVDFKA